LGEGLSISNLPGCPATLPCRGQAGQHTLTALNGLWLGRPAMNLKHKSVGGVVPAAVSGRADLSNADDFMTALALARFNAD
jgi:hypothetical protein